LAVLDENSELSIRTTWLSAIQMAPPRAALVFME
jgi:hypothetical protein